MIGPTSVETRLLISLVRLILFAVAAVVLYLYELDVPAGVFLGLVIGEVGGSVGKATVLQHRSLQPASTPRAVEQEREDTGRIQLADAQRRAPTVTTLSTNDDLEGEPFPDRDTPPETPIAKLPGAQAKRDRYTPTEREIDDLIRLKSYDAARELARGTQYAREVDDRISRIVRAARERGER